MTNRSFVTPTLLVLHLSLLVGCMTRSATDDTASEYDTTYYRLLHALAWMEVAAFDDADAFAESFPPLRVAEDGEYTHYYYVDGPYASLSVTALNGELVSAEAVKDFPGSFTYFDEDPGTLRQRYSRLKRDLDIMELLMQVDPSAFEHED